MPDNRLDIELAATDHMSSVFHRAGENARNEMNLLEQLNESVGRSSEFTHVLHALEGGGAAMGLSLAGRMMSEVTEKAIQLKEELNEGKKSSGEIAEELLKSIPILGGFYAAEFNIKELITGEKALRKQIAEDQKAYGEAQQAIVEHIRQEAEAVRETTKALREQAQAKALMGLGGDPKAFAESTNRQGNRKEDAEQEIEEIRERVQAKYIKEIGEQQDIINKASEKLRAERAKPVHQATADPELHEATKARQAALAQERQLTVTMNNEIEAELKKAAAKRGTEDTNDAGAQTELRNKLAKERDEYLRKTQEERDRTAGEARREMLKSQGKELAAELDKLDEDAQRATTERARKTAEEMKKIADEQKAGVFKTPADADKARADIQASAQSEADAARAKYDADVAEARHAEAARAAERNAEIDKLAAESKKSVLQAEAEAGNHLAENELKRLEIAEKYREEHEKINKLLRDENTTWLQRLKLMFIDAGAAAAEKKEEAAVGRNRVDYSGFKLDTDRGDTGIRQAFAERQYESKKDPAQLQKEGIDQLTNWLSKAFGTGTPIGDALKSILQAVSGPVNAVS